MTLDSVNYVAFFAGILLLTIGSGYRAHPWRYSEALARSEPRKERREVSHNQQWGPS